MESIDSGIWSSESGDPEFGIRNSEFGIRNSGIRDSEVGIRIVRPVSSWRADASATTYKDIEKRIIIITDPGITRKLKVLNRRFKLL